MSKHTTKGTWTVGVYSTTETMLERLRKNPQSCVCRKEDMMLIALCGEADDLNSRADADLIAAAPELLAALKDAVDHWLSAITTHHDIKQWQEVIAKAEGIPF